LTIYLILEKGKEVETPMVFRRFAALCSCLGFAFLTFIGAASADTEIYPFRFPVLSNPNAVGGRLYLQPLGTHDHRVIDKTELSLSFGSATDYNVHFIEKEGDKELTVNTNTYSLSISTGFPLFGRTFETGGVFTAFQDMKKTWGSELVKNYHQMFSKGFGQVPPDGQYYGAVGENETEVIGKNREFFLNTLQLYAKTQILREGPGRPDLAVKLSGRVPLSGKNFDTPGLALSAGLSKKMTSSLSFIGSGGFVFQDLTNRDFNANNLKVRHFAMDLFSGLIWDMGKDEGWYSQLGMRWSSERVSYRKNPESAGPSYVVHFGPVYRAKTRNGGVIEYFLSCSEDIPGLGYGLEPDVGFYAGVALGFP
jgi:hypothetical protein